MTGMMIGMQTEMMTGGDHMGDDRDDDSETCRHQRLSRMIDEGFSRKGIVGDWKNHFSQQKSQEWNRSSLW